MLKPLGEDKSTQQMENLYSLQVKLTVENGVITYPIKGATLIGSGFEVLKKLNLLVMIYRWIQVLVRVVKTDRCSRRSWATTEN